MYNFNADTHDANITTIYDINRISFEQLSSGSYICKKPIGSGVIEAVR